MFRTILVPFDGSPFSRQAVPVAAAIARRTGGRVRLVRVHTPPPASDAMFGVAADNEPWEMAEERKALDGLADELTRSGVPADAALVCGPVVPTLAGFAAAVGADLVVMTTHGRGPLGRAVLGSVADPLVRKLTAPTLLVRPADPPAAAPRHLLVALDGSADAEAMLPPAVELAAAVGAAVTLVRVVEPVVLQAMTAAGIPVPYDAPEETARLHGMADAYLERVATPLRGQGLDVRTRVVDAADPATALLAAADAAGCDLIALESHGRHGLDRFILGSVTDAVVRRGRTPVLTHAAAH